MNVISSTKTEKLFLRKKLMQIDSLFFSFVALITEKKVADIKRSLLYMEFQIQVLHY